MEEFDPTSLYDREFRQRVTDALSDCPIVEVTGLLVHYGQGEFAQVGFMMPIWRLPETTFRVYPIHLQLPLSESTLQPRSIPSFFPIQIQCRISEPDRIGLLIEISDSVSDDERLNHLIKRYREPVTYLDERFGLFREDIVLDNYFDGSVIWKGEKISTSLTPNHDFPEDLGRRLKESANCLGKLIDNHEEWYSRVVDFADSELRHVANDFWLSDGDPEITPENFKSRIRLTSLMMCASGAFEFRFDDGDIFWGHEICVRGDLTNGPDHAEF